MKHVKSIGFVFENCEYFTMNAKYFGTLDLTDFDTHIERIACNAIAKMNCVGTVAMEIFPEGDGEFPSFGDSITKFKRLKMFDDITSIIIIYDDGTEEEYYVNYEGEATNKYQKTYLSKFGLLYIVISKDKDIFDFFDEEDIHDKGYVDFAKSMLMY